jgi:hypothetical protein
MAFSVRSAPAAHSRTVKKYPGMSRLALHLTRLLMQLLLVPIVAVVVPLLFALAWLHEVLTDLTGGALPRGRLLPSPLLARVRDVRERDLTR